MKRHSQHAQRGATAKAARKSSLAFRVEDGDWDIVHSRQESLSKHKGKVIASQRSPMKGRTPWQRQAPWDPQNDDPTFALDENGQLYEEELGCDPFDAPSAEEAPRKTKKRSRRSRRPQQIWAEKYRASYLDEGLRAEGRGDFRFDVCVDCQARRVSDVQAGSFCCKDCFIRDLVCANCCVRRHRQAPFHRIEEWRGGYFHSRSLKSLGLVIHLNHMSSHCPSSRTSHKSFQVLHTNSLHDVTVLFCGCERTIDEYKQLLRRDLYPSTQGNIQTCATFALLDHLHLLSLVTKAGTYELYQFLEKRTNNTGVDLPKSRYRALQRMLLQWRDLKMLKRGGRGNDPDGIEATGEGDLAVECPSCPHKGKNLTKGWEDVPPEKRFLYALYICMDFNFRLKNQLVSSWSRDPGLADGLSYFVPRGPYEAHITKFTDEEDVSTCVGFAALAQRTTRSSRGLRYTGVGAVVCGRSEMILPNGVCNLEKGERYCNSDIIFAFALRRYIEWLLALIVAYDIMCQWFVNLFARMDNWDPALRIPQGLYMTPVIPKFHHQAHEENDEHDQLDCKLAEGLADCDCECCERCWAALNAAAPSTKPMGPGSRILVLNDHFGHYNWGKYSGHGNILSKRYVNAVKQRNLQTEAHRGLSKALPEGLEEEWEELCVKWDLSKGEDDVVNPYRAKRTYLSQKQVERELAEYEEDRVRKGGATYHDTSAGAFLTLGLELEESQRRIRRMAKPGSKATDNASRSITEMRTVLRRKIRDWVLIRHIYMPGLLRALREMGEEFMDGTNDDMLAEDIPLFMPSSLTKEKRIAACIDGVAEMEERLREAQCHDSLSTVRHTLRLKTRMVLFKHANVTGQREGVRSRTTINSVHERARNAAEVYRAARKALLGLRGAGPDSWERVLRPLNDNDVRSYVDPERMKEGRGRLGTNEDEVDDGIGVSATTADGGGINLVPEDRHDKVTGRFAGTGQSKHTISWIWLGHDAIDTSDGTDIDDEILREVWAKSRARARRATEAVELVKEEMHRTLEYLAHKARWWRGRLGKRAVSGDLQEGLTAYALNQEAIQVRLASCFKASWTKPLSEMEKAAVDAPDGVADGNDQEEEIEDEADQEGEGEGEGDGVEAASGNE
ncbi:hypothetical protein V5O48_009059 [Marasmius crinis-equi]|uniref:CxC2-like cysteine cluster KDZ transposase-associated domain-containing protein n=1 Tax=Marasmius crinis-equi TaxID=585013 RepID=A0ABR3FCS8_9AGAR